MAKNQNLSPEQLREALSLLKQLKKGYDDLGKENPLKGINAANLESFIQGAGGIKNILKQWTIELDNVDDQLENLGKSAKGIFTQFSNIVGELKKSNQNLNIGNKAMKSFQDIAEKVKNDQQGITDLNKKDLLTLIQKQKQSVSNLDIANKALKIQINRGELEGKELENAKNLIAEREKEATAISDLNKLLQERLEEEEKIESKTGLTGKLLEGFKKIPVLGDILDIDGAKTAMRDAAKTGASGFSTLGTGIKALGPSLTAALGPLALISLAVAAFKALIDVMFEADKRVTDIAKNMSLTKDEARGVYKSLTLSKGEIKTIYNDTENLVIAFTDLSQITDFISSATNKQLESQIILTKQLGLSKEEALGYQEALINSNEDQEKGLDIVYDQIAAFANQNKITANASAIFKEIGKTSKLIQLNFRGNLDELTKTVLEAKKLGLTLDQVDKVADSLLNFEESISSELEAELLLGQDINLEKARTFALNNDIAGLTKEIANQGITAEKYSRLNRIQQEALAKTLGMSSKELGDSLYQQQLIQRTGGKELEQMKERAKMLREEKKDSEAMALEKKAALIEQGLLRGEDIKQAKESASAQEKFEQAVKRVKEVFTDLVDGGTLDKLVDYLERFVSSLESKGLTQTILFGPNEMSDVASAKSEEFRKRAENEQDSSKKEELFKKAEEEKRKASEALIKEKEKDKKEIDTNLLLTAFNPLFGLKSAAYDAITDFGLAEGGITQKPQTRLIGEAGPEAVVPLTEFYAKIDELISAVKQGGNVYLDSQKVTGALKISSYKADYGVS